MDKDDNIKMNPTIMFENELEASPFKTWASGDSNYHDDANLH